MPIEKILFHGSTHLIDTFDIAHMLGIHLGTQRAAMDRLRTTGRDRTDTTLEELADGRCIVKEFTYDNQPPIEHGPFESEDAAQSVLKNMAPARAPQAFFATLQKPLRMPDLGTWDFTIVARHLASEKIITDSSRLSKLWDAWAISDVSGFEALRQELQLAGYDSIVYRNSVEDTGSDSYIALSNDQVVAMHGQESNEFAVAFVQAGLPALLAIRQSMAAAGHDDLGHIQLQVGDEDLQLILQCTSDPRKQIAIQLCDPISEGAGHLLFATASEEITGMIWAPDAFTPAAARISPDEIATCLKDLMNPIDVALRADSEWTRNSMSEFPVYA